MMASIKQRIESLEQEAGGAFTGYALICRWEYDGATSADGIDAYITENGPVPDDKQVATMGWAC